MRWLQKHRYRSRHAERDPDWTADVDARIKFGIDTFKSRGFLKSNDKVVIITGWRKGAGATNTLRIIEIS